MATNLYNLPENLYVYNTVFFSNYSPVSNVKWPCCLKCTVLIMRNHESDSAECCYKLIGCKKCNHLKETIYTQEEFDKLL